MGHSVSHCTPRTDWLVCPSLDVCPENCWVCGLLPVLTSLVVVLPLLRGMSPEWGAPHLSLTQRGALFHISQLMRCKTGISGRPNQGRPCSSGPTRCRGPMVDGHSVSLPPPCQPSTWETCGVCLEYIMLYSGCLPTALAENKGDDVSGSLRERKQAARNYGFYWPDHLGTKAEWSLSQSFSCWGGAEGGKAASFPSPVAARLDSMLCLWVLHVPLLLVSSPLGCGWGAAHA